MHRRQFFRTIGAGAGAALASAATAPALQPSNGEPSEASRTPPRPRRGDFIYVSQGEFWLGDKTWRPFGVNYWPRYATSQRICGAVLWYDPVRYQPEIVEKDFAILESVGADCIAIALVPSLIEPEFWFQDTHVAYSDYRGPFPDRNVKNLLDVLDRAAKHGLRVGCYLLGCHPFYFNEAIAHYWLVKVGLKDDPRIWAFDIAWEPHLVDHANHQWRKKLDPQWTAWVADRYGSIEEAIADWGYPPKDSAKDCVPSPDPVHLQSPGPWDGWVAAYARWFHNHVGACYRVAMAKLRQLDPNHLFGGHTVGLIGQIIEGLRPQTEIPARGGDPLYYHDAQAVGLHLDYLGAEWRVHPMSVYHAKLWSGGKPVIFGEFGFNLAGQPDGKAKQAQAYREHLETILASGAQGAIAWWWPGGSRMCEGGSDFGLIEPDGTPRPVLEVFKQYAPKFAHPSPRRADAGPEERLTVEGDRYSPAFFSSCNRAARQLEQHIRQGRRVRVVTAGTNTDSASCPLVTVSGLPYQGRGLPRHLDAQFVEVAFRADSGDWKRLAPQDRLLLPARGEVSFRVAVQNIQQSTWKAGTAPGSVSLGVFADGKPVAEIPLPSGVPFGGKASLQFSLASERLHPSREVVLQLTARQRCRFGDRLRLGVAVLRDA